MDIYCPKCGEPWDNDELHHEAEDNDSDYETVAKNFRRRGCEVFGFQHGDADYEVNGMPASTAASALYELLGDDMDGAAAMMEDLGY